MAAPKFVEGERTIFTAEDPAKGPFTRFDPASGKWVERAPWTAERLEAVAANSDPTTGTIKTRFGEDLDPQASIGHVDDLPLLRTLNLPSGGGTRSVRYDAATGELKWGYRLHPEIAGMVRDGRLPKISPEFYPDYKGVGPALRGVALLGTEQPVRKDLGLWDPKLYQANSEGGNGAAVRQPPAGSRFIRFGEASGTEVVLFQEANMPKPSAATTEDPKAGEADPATKAPAAKPPAPAKSEDFAERISALEAEHAVALRTITEKDAKIAALDARVAVGEKRAMAVEVDAFCESLKADGLAVGADLEKIRKAMRQLRGVEAFAEADVKEPAAVLQTVLRQVLRKQAIDVSGRTITAEAGGVDNFSEQATAALRRWEKDPLGKGKCTLEGFTRGVMGEAFSEERFSEWDAARKGGAAGNGKAGGAKS